jgi:hypothetical protein
MQTDREAFNEFARGAILPIIVLGLFFTFILTLSDPEEKPQEKFKVVDKYGPCEVVRYSPNGSAKYAYLLDCK